MSTETVEKKEKKRRTRYNVGNKQLLEVYMQSAQDPQVTADKLKMSMSAVSSRISSLRKKHNVEIPRKPRSHKILSDNEKAELQAIIGKYQHN